MFDAIAEPSSEAAMPTPPKEAPLADAERLRRVVILCESFARNLAYHCVARAKCSITHPHTSFWRQAHSNFLDVCVLEWCKLFGESKRAETTTGWGEHGWRSVVTDAAVFEAGLIARLGMTDAMEFDDVVERMRHYRDKFVAHLDAEREMDIPMLCHARQSV